MRLSYALKKEGLDTVEYEERILNQIMFTREREEGMLDVLLSYLEKRENDDLTVSLLEIYSIYYFMGRKNVPDSYFAILDRQSGRENGLSFMSKLSYLLRKAQAGYSLDERACIQSYVKSFGEKQMVFDFFDAFREFVEISPILKEMTCFYCYGEEGLELKLALKIKSKEGGTRLETIEMEEVNPGFYFGRAYLLLDETVTEKRLFHQEKEICTVLMQTKMNTVVDGSRSDLLNRMGENKGKAGKVLEKYQEVLVRMNEQLQIIT